MSPLLALPALTFLVALVYSSVGHGGASGYLAVLTLFSFPHEQMAASALVLNLLVASTAWRSFSRAGHFSWRLTGPFIWTSIPAAFLGGLIKVPPPVYALLLGGVLMFAAFRLFFDRPLGDVGTDIHLPRLFIPAALGLGIGILSGMVGVGGGIFLSPLLVLLRWAPPKVTSASSAFFIFANSLAGLLGRWVRKGFVIEPSLILIPIVAAAFLGGIVGSRLGANHFSGQWLKRILALVLLIAAFKLLRSL